MAKFPNASKMKTINSCKSLNYSRPSAKRLCARPATDDFSIVWQTRFLSSVFSARLIECRQANWFSNQFECFAAFLGVQVHSLFATLYVLYLLTSSHHRKREHISYRSENIIQFFEKWARGGKWPRLIAYLRQNTNAHENSEKINLACGMLSKRDRIIQPLAHTPTTRKNSNAASFPTRCSLHFVALACGDHNNDLHRSHTMRKCNFHVRHITFKCCLNYLLARPLWERPSATRLHGRIARETILLSARVPPNATNCRSLALVGYKLKIEISHFVMSWIPTYQITCGWLQMKSRIRCHRQNIRIASERCRRKKWCNFGHVSILSVSVRRLIEWIHLLDDITLHTNNYCEMMRSPDDEKMENV